MSTSKVVPLTCHGHSRPVTHLSFSSAVDDDQSYLISACKDNNPMLRDGITGDWIGTFIGHKGAVWQARLSGDAGVAATGSADFTAKVWDTHSGECLFTFQHNHIVRAVAFPPHLNPQTLATGGFEKRLRIFDLMQTSSTSSSPNSADGASVLPTNAASYEIGVGMHGGPIKSIVWGPDRNIIVSACDDKMVRWWDIRSRTPIASYGLDGVVGSCELNTLTSSNVYRDPVLSIAAGKSAYFFSGINPGQLIKQVKTPHEVASVALNAAERKFIVGGSADTWVRVYSFDEERELDLHKGHHGPIWSTSFSPNGKLYATGSEDGTIKLWKFCKEAYGLWR